MVNSEDFYNIEMYDGLMLKMCEPYKEFLQIAANALPSGLKSVCDIGIGTGNLSKLVKKRFPTIEIHGIDMNTDLLHVAKNKIKGLKTYKLDINHDNFPKVDYFISSMTLHHLDTNKRKDGLLKMMNNSKGLINFDIVLDNKYDLNRTIKSVLNFAKKSFNNKKALKEIENELRIKDNYMYIGEQKEIFKSAGMDFEILAKKQPYIVYKVSRKE